MTLREIDSYLASLRLELTWRKDGPVHKIRVKQLEVAIKVRAVNFPDAPSGR
jgi:predicted enzyme involved in methoxymalonyl-ACP biosynthesis